MTEQKKGFSVEDKGEYYELFFIPNSGNDYQMTVHKQYVSTFANFLLGLNYQGTDEYYINKIKFQSYLSRNLPHTKDLEIKMNGRSIDHHPQRDRLYASIFRDGIDKGLYYRYYNLPLKILEFYDCIGVDRYDIVVFPKKLLEFIEKRLVDENGEQYKEGKKIRTKDSK